MWYFDYCDVVEIGFDVVFLIGLIEYIGVKNYLFYFGFFKLKLCIGGLLFNYCIICYDNRLMFFVGGFIDCYVFFDGELMGLGCIIIEI